MHSLGFPSGSVGKISACNARDVGLIPGSGRSTGGGHGNPLQCSCLENPMDRGAWQATVHRVAKSWTGLKCQTRHTRVFLFFTVIINVCLFYIFQLIRYIVKTSFSLVQSLSRVRLFVTPWIAARQTSLSITNSWSSLRFTWFPFYILIIFASMLSPFSHI